MTGSRIPLRVLLFCDLPSGKTLSGIHFIIDSREHLVGSAVHWVFQTRCLECPLNSANNLVWTCGNFSVSPYFSKVLLTLKFPNELCKHGCLHCGLQIEVRENFVTLNDSLFCPKFYPNLTESYPDISALGYSPEITRRVRRHSATMCGSHPMFVTLYIPLYIFILYICPMFFYSFFLT